MHVTITAVDRGDPDGERLRRLRTEELRRQYDRERCEEPFAEDVALFLLARDRASGVAVACGALRPFDGGAEVTHLYVVPQRRGEGLAGVVLDELERQALALGWLRLRVLAGRRRPEAIRLCRRAGFSQVPNAGPHVGQPESVCFEKRLDPC